MNNLTCSNCGKSFAGRENKKFCSTKCRVYSGRKDVTDTTPAVTNVTDTKIIRNNVTPSRKQSVTDSKAVEDKSVQTELTRAIIKELTTPSICAKGLEGCVKDTPTSHTPNCSKSCQDGIHNKEHWTQNDVDTCVKILEAKIA